MIVWNHFPQGEHRTQCPICQRRDKSLGVSVFSHESAAAHCFRCGYVETRRPQRELTPAEREAYKRRMDAMRQQHDAEQRERQAAAASIAAVRWAAAKPVQAHPYLERKAVMAHGLRLEGDMLLIPLRDSAGTLMSLQTIAAAAPTSWDDVDGPWWRAYEAVRLVARTLDKGDCTAQRYLDGAICEFEALAGAVELLEDTP